jgi:hypothetical protein
MIPFKNNGALMTFEIQEPNQREMDAHYAGTLDHVVTITSDKLWVLAEACDTGNLLAQAAAAEHIDPVILLVAAAARQPSINVILAPPPKPAGGYWAGSNIKSKAERDELDGLFDPFNVLGCNEDTDDEDATTPVETAAI